MNNINQCRTLTYENPQQRPHDDHHHKDHSSGDDGDVWDVQQAHPQLLEALGLPSGLPVLPANLLQGVVNGGHLHRHICNLQQEEMCHQRRSKFYVAFSESDSPCESHPKKKGNNTRHVMMCSSILQSLHQFRLEEDEQQQK